MMEAVKNHGPDVVVIDEIGSKEVGVGVGMGWGGEG
jgi:stage III sporulation protein SpoIIIAA